MLNKFLLVFLLLIIIKPSIAQNSLKENDSLIHVLAGRRDDTARVNLLITITRNLYQTGDYNKALAYAKEALALSEKLKFQMGIALAYNKAGIIYLEQGNYPEALRNQLASLKIVEQTGDKRRIASTYTNIGNIYFEQGNFPEALKNHLLSLKIEQEIGNKQGVAGSYLNIGSVYGRQGNFEEALKNYSAAAVAAENIKNRLDITAASYNNIGTIYAQQGNYKEALKNLLASLKIDEEIGDKNGIATSYVNVGELYLKIRKSAEGKKYLDKGLLLSKQIGSKYLVKESYFGLAQYDSLSGNTGEAYKHFKLYSLMKDSLLNEESNKQLSQLKIQYETGKKDQQIKTQNLELKTKNLQLQNETLSNKILQTRVYYGIGVFLIIIGIIVLLFNLRSRRKKKEYEHLLTDLELTVLKSQLNPHFISNSLITIKAFIDQQPEKASQFLYKFAGFLRRVLQQTEQSVISLKEELEMAELYMQIESLRIKHGFDYHFECDSSIDQKSIMIPPLLLQPTIENAIWHGLAKKGARGNITIGVKLDGHLLKFTIEDDGVGKRQEVPEENHSPAGGKRKSFGLSITRKRIDVLNKEFKSEGYYNLTFLNGRTLAEIAIPVNYS